MQVPIQRPPVQSPNVLNTHQREYQPNAAMQQQPGRLIQLPQSPPNPDTCRHCRSGEQSVNCESPY